jgi:hypothetical protein
MAKRPNPSIKELFSARIGGARIVNALIKEFGSEMRLRDLASVTYIGLLRIPNLGKVSIETIKATLGEHGYELREKAFKCHTHPWGHWEAKEALACIRQHVEPMEASARELEQFIAERSD